jgi:hypothetical protein
LSVDGSPASELVVAEGAVIRRFVGAVGADWSLGGGGGGRLAGAAETKTRAKARTHAANAVVRTGIWILPWAFTSHREIRPSLATGFADYALADV